jgi:MtN3 and saliva related transmembrane protein
MYSHYLLGGLTLHLTDVLGLLAGILTTFAVIPQIIRVYKLKSAREISVLYTSALLLGVICWLVYGIMLHLWPLIVWNILGSVFNAILLLSKLKYGR